MRLRTAILAAVLCVCATSASAAPFTYTLSGTIVSSGLDPWLPGVVPGAPLTGNLVVDLDTIATYNTNVELTVGDHMFTGGGGLTWEPDSTGEWIFSAFVGPRIITATPVLHAYSLILRLQLLGGQPQSAIVLFRAEGVKMVDDVLTWVTPGFTGTVDVAVPEPGSLTLLALGAGFLWRQRRNVAHG